jgi:multidrug efflux pump subunit AcrB
MRSPFSRNIVLVVGVLIGIILLPYVSIQLHPSPRSQRLSISFNYPGARPEVVEQEVVSRMESTLATLRGLQSIRSVSDLGYGSIGLVFDRSIDMEKKRLEVATMLRQVYQQLEAPISYPEINFVSEFTEQELLLLYTLSSPQNAPSLKATIEEKIIPELALEEGISEVRLAGIPNEEFRITIHETLRKSLDIELFEIQNAIKEQFTPRELGLTIVREPTKSVIRAVRYGNTSNIKLPKRLLARIPVAERSGRIIYLSELADIEKKESHPDRYFRVNGQRAVTLMIYTTPGVNQIRLARAMRKKVSQLETSLGDSIQFRLVLDESQFLSDSLNKIARRTGASLILLLLFLIAVRPKFKYLLLIGGSLLATLLLAIIAYYFLELELHLYSIAGWTLSIGIILDNLIVMADHIRNQGNQRIFPAILAATLTTVGALSVVFFIEATYRESLGDFSGIFMVNLLVSLLVALFFVPSLYRALYSEKQQGPYSIRRKRLAVHFTKYFRGFILLGLRFRKIMLLILILAFGLPIFLLPEEWDANHSVANWYNRTIGSEYYQRTLKSPLDNYLGGSFHLFYKEQDRFYLQTEKPEKTRLFLRANMPYGGTIDQLNEVILSIEQQLAFYKQIDQYLSRVNGPDEASIEITFKEAFEEGRFPYELKKRLETIAVETGSAEFSVYGVGQGFSNALRGNPLNDRIQLLGYNYAQLWQLAEQAKDLFLQHLRIQEAYINAELTYYAPNETYFLVRLPEVSQLQQNKLSPSNIGDLLQQSREEALPAASLLSEGNTYSINLLTDQKGRSQLWNLRNAPYLLDSSQVYKHGAYLQLEQTKGQQKIVRVDQQYQLVLAYDFIGNYELGREVMEQKIDTLNQNLPLGYEVGRYGRNRFWDFQRNQSKMIGILGIALVVIFMINAILFNSLRQAFVPLLLIIPGFIGIFLTVYFFNFRFDQGGFAAFLLVAGLSVNAGLLLINDYNNYRFRYPKRTAIKVFIKAFNSKIIPIVLTALSTILGLLPFILFESHEVFWYALAMCSIGGMICSTLAVYLFFPILFLRRKDRFADLKSTQSLNSPKL